MALYLYQDSSVEIIGVGGTHTCGANNNVTTSDEEDENSSDGSDSVDNDVNGDGVGYFGEAGNSETVLMLVAEKFIVIT